MQATWGGLLTPLDYTLYVKDEIMLSYHVMYEIFYLARVTVDKSTKKLADYTQKASRSN